MYNNNIRTDSEIHQFINSEFRNDRLRLEWPLGQVLWDRNPGFLKSEIEPFSDFKEKSYLMGLKSAHFQEYDFQESGVGDRFLKMGTHFQERPGSLENGLCVTWSGFWVCPGYLWLLILVAAEQIDDQITRRLVAQRVAPAARVILSQTPSFRRWMLLMETMAYWQQVSLSLPRCSYLFVHQIRRRRRAARSLTSQGRAEPLCARITGLNREVSEGKADL